MTKREMYYQGRDLWFEYARVNGYSWEPNAEGIRKLSKSLDLKQSFIRKCINVYLEA